ncbi:unnamed protein product [Phytophthora fragariaefolia]|uniref:Unnamed protein product n=1 Tax=Phytophthora fragariaefolia TaxID=1490495 RepID=A0A9W6Y4D9_9STRA|nr:unnamed protein product [Phytophthora fragariaefolia]
MLAAHRNLRRVTTSSLLRRPARHAVNKRLLPAYCAAQSPLESRKFSLQNGSETLLGRLKDSLSDAAATVTVMAQEASGAVLSDDEATTLLQAFAKHKKIGDCIGLLQFCRENLLRTETSARAKAFRVLSDAGELLPTLQLFESLLRDDAELKPWMVGRALHVASKLNRSDVVANTFRRLASKNCDVGGERVRDMLRRVGEQGGEMDEFALRSLAIFADRAGEADLALEVLSLMKRRGNDVSVDFYASVMGACGKEERWTDLVKVYEEMPENLRPKLYSGSLNLIITAHTRSEKRYMTLRGLEIFHQHMAGKWNTSPCNAALEALLQTRQFDRVFALTKEMNQNDVEWNSITFKILTRAHIEIGSAEDAKEMLFANAEVIQDRAIECYRELAMYYTNVRRDSVEACKLYLEMIQNGLKLEPPDWKTALELSVGLPDQTMYWCFRKQLQLDRPAKALIPPRLFLPEPVELHEQRAVQLQSEAGFKHRESGSTDSTTISPEVKSAIHKWDTGGEKLTEKEAFALLSRLANNGEAAECTKLLEYCEQQGLFPCSNTEPFHALCDASHYDAALQVFQTLCKGRTTVSPQMYGKALDAAIKMKRNDLMMYVLRRLLGGGSGFNGEKMETSGKGVHAVMNGIRNRGVKLSKVALRSLAAFANQSGELELAIDVLSMMKNEGMHITLDVYGSALNAYGQCGRWSDVMRLYNSMPEPLRSRIDNTSRDWVVTASNNYNSQDAFHASTSTNRSRTKKQTTSPPTTQLLDPLRARTTFDEIRKSGGQGLSTNLATTLLVTMANHGRIYDCIDMVNYFKEHGVTTKLLSDLAVFVAFCTAKEFEYALQIFEKISKGGYNLEPWVYGWALSAASKLHRQEIITTIFQVLVPEAGEQKVGVTEAGRFHVEDCEDHVYDMLRDALHHGVDVPTFALQSLASFALKTYHSDLALEILSAMQSKHVTISNNEFRAALSSCAKEGRWGDVMLVFKEMPGNLRATMASPSLGAVVKAHTYSGDTDLTLCGLEFFENHEAKWGKFACNAALEALLETSQSDGALALANDMKQHGVKWSSKTYRYVALAYIRTGLIYKATAFLSGNMKQMQNYSGDPYRELIDYYMSTREDRLMACQLSVDLIQNNRQIGFSDWYGALKLTYELPDKSLYWYVRKQLWLRDQASEQKLPSDLMLIKRDSPVDGGLHLVQERVHDMQPEPAEVSLALEVFDDICNADGSGLTENTATNLLVALAKHKRIGDCAEMLDYFKENRIKPKPFARVAVFKLFCDAMEGDLAMQLFASMLHDDVHLNASDCIFGLNAAMKLKNHDLVGQIIDYMQQNSKRISIEDYAKITPRNFGRNEEWGATVQMLSALLGSDRRGGVIGVRQY